MNSTGKRTLSAEEFDAWLRDRAPPLSGPIEPGRDALWRALHARGRRRGRPHLAPVGLLTFLLLLAAQPLDVGSDAKRPIVRQHPTLGTVYDSRFTGTSVTGLGGIPDVESREQAFDAILENEMTRSAPLTRVSGFRINGRVSYVLIYSPSRDGKTYPTGFHPLFPTDEDQPEALAFLHTCAGQLLERVATGTARDAGVTCGFFDGRPVALRRWTSSFPVFGNVTYYQGEPLS